MTVAARPPRVLVCGSRNWGERLGPGSRYVNAVERLLVRRAVHLLPPGSVVVEGEARGADRLAARYARRYGLAVEAYPADWRRYGRDAGRLRNVEMLLRGRPDAVVWFARDLSVSRGTADMVRRATAAGVPTYAGHRWGRETLEEVLLSLKPSTPS